MRYGRLAGFILFLLVVSTLGQASLPGSGYIISVDAQKHPEELPFFLPGIYSREDFLGVLNEFYSFYVSTGDVETAMHVKEIWDIVSSDSSTPYDYYNATENMIFYLESIASAGHITGMSRAITLSAFSVYTPDLNTFFFNINRYSNITLSILLSYVDVYQETRWNTGISSLAIAFSHAVASLEPSTKDYAISLNASGDAMAQELAEEGLRIYYLARMLAGMIDNETLQAIIEMYLDDGLLNASTATTILQSLNNTNESINLNQLLENTNLSSLTTLTKAIDAYRYLNQTGLNIEDVFQALQQIGNLTGDGEAETITDLKELDQLFENTEYPKTPLTGGNNGETSVPSLQILSFSFNIASPSMSSILYYLFIFVVLLLLIGSIFLIYNNRHMVASLIYRTLPWLRTDVPMLDRITGTPEEVNTCYKKAIRLTGRIGYPKMPWETPREHEERLPAWLKDVMERIVDVYERVRYGKLIPSPNEVRECFIELRRLHELARPT